MTDRSPSSGQPGGIDSEIDVRRVLEITAWLAAITVAAVVIGYFVYRSLGNASLRAEARRSPLAEASAPVEPPAPRLQLHPEADLQTLRAKNDARLSSWGWVDRTAGVAHMPISEAIDRLAVPDPSPAAPAEPVATAEAAPADAAHAPGSGH